MNMTLLINGMLFASAVLVFFLSIQINKIIKKRFDLINEYKKDLEEYKQSLHDYINFIDSVQNDLKDLKNICNHIKQTYNDR